MGGSARCSRRQLAVAAIGTAAAACLSRIASALPPPASPVLAAIRERGALRVGMSPGFAPFVVAGDACAPLLDLVLGDKPEPVLAPDGRRLAGFDVDLSVILASALAVRLDIATFDRLDAVFDAIGRGEVDVGLSGMTRTLQRAASLAFSTPYLVSGLQIFASDLARFPTLPSVTTAGVRVGVKAGTTGEQFARQSLGSASLVPLPSNDDIFRALESKAVDAVVADGLVGRDMILRKRVPAGAGAVESRRFTNEPIAMACRQADGDWQAWLSLAVHELRSDGRFHALAHRYNPWLRTQR